MSRGFALRTFPFSPKGVSNAHMRKCPEYNGIVLPNRHQNHTLGLVLMKIQGPVVSLTHTHTHTRAHALAHAHMCTSPHLKLSPAKGLLPFPQETPVQPHTGSCWERWLWQKFLVEGQICLSNDGWNYLQKALQ